MTGLVEVAAHSLPIVSGVLGLLGAIISIVLTARRVRAETTLHRILALELRRDAKLLQHRADRFDDLRDAVRRALLSMDEPSRALLERGLEQPSKEGQKRFVERQVNASVIEERRAVH
jgi:hypothetical protein